MNVLIYTLDRLGHFYLHDVDLYLYVIDDWGNSIRVDIYINKQFMISNWSIDCYDRTT